MIDKSDDDIDQPGTKHLLRDQDVPIDIRYDKYNHWSVLQDIPNSQRCKYEGCTKKKIYQCSRGKVFFMCADNQPFFYCIFWCRD